MKLLFLGRKKSGAEVLEWSINHGFDVIGVLTDNHILGSETTKIANKYSIPILSLEEVYSKILNNEIHFDLAVSFVYWRILKEPLISYPQNGIINFHPAPLPEFKGTGGYNLAILKSLKKWSVTAHYIDKGIDTGGIIDSIEFNIDEKVETAKSLEQKSQKFMKALYKRTLNAVKKSGLLNTTENVGGRYISRKEMEEMKKILPNDDIEKKIRAFWFPPYTGAYIEINGAKYTLINQSILNSLTEKYKSNIFSPDKKSK